MVNARARDIAHLHSPTHDHPDVSGGWLRAAVFGAMDGLVSNISLIAGVGGGGASSHAIVLTGAAGLSAGAISMALGEYTSVRTQNDQILRELEKERHELRTNPEVERRELELMLQQRGYSEELSHRVAQEVSKDPELALHTHVQEELGVVPDQSASPWLAAISSFLCFAIGAGIPLAPYLLGGDVLLLSLVIGGVGLFAVGAAVSRFTNRSWFASGARQFLFGAAAAGITYLVGLLIGGVVA
ncbi:MAG TPA: VIT1/CCC1 transporter family protein [Mycobacteriales bacterium]|nr:VIT1/CCC1 transporter family protein [Mycobacteriales bacterium]